ncbi:MAG: sulfurtransferase [Terriglobia bacterium]|jgi:thiosulfate/3-mercaptopyruvate sulfurtransferase
MEKALFALASVLFIASLASRSAPAADAASASPLLVETADLAPRLNEPGLRILDARTPQEYRQGHIPGAVNLPAPATESLEANRQGFPLFPERAAELFRATGINASSRIVVYDNQGHRFAARLFYVLEFFGHPQVSVLNGGWAKWQSEDRPTTMDEPRVPPGDFKPDAKSSVIATADWVQQHLTDPGVKLVDARTPAEYSGEKVQGPRGGHVPGAVNIEWTRVLAGGDPRTLLELPALRKLFADAAVKPEQEVVAYCQMGMRASQIYFALRLLGYPRVRVYDGSWEDWASRSDLPIEK